MSAAQHLAKPSDPQPSQEDAPAQFESVNSALEGQLRAALRGGFHVPYDRQIRADCFLFGALCAKAEAQIPEWMNNVVLWAHEAALQGYFAFWRQRANVSDSEGAGRSAGMGELNSAHTRVVRGLTRKLCHGPAHPARHDASEPGDVGKPPARDAAGWAQAVAASLA